MSEMEGKRGMLSVVAVVTVAVALMVVPATVSLVTLVGGLFFSSYSH